MTDINNLPINIPNPIIVKPKPKITPLERLYALKALREAELKGDNDPRYIEDLNLSIADLERGMK